MAQLAFRLGPLPSIRGHDEAQGDEKILKNYLMSPPFRRIEDRF